jgi:hypothetical protein
MIVSIKVYDNGVTIISYRAETDEDRGANQLLLCRYDNVPVIGSESIIGSFSGDGSTLDIKVHPLTSDEIKRNERADAMIGALNLIGRRVAAGHTTHNMIEEEGRLLLPDLRR